MKVLENACETCQGNISIAGEGFVCLECGKVYPASRKDQEFFLGHSVEYGEGERYDLTGAGEMLLSSMKKGAKYNDSQLEIIVQMIKAHRGLLGDEVDTKFLIREGFIKEQEG